MMLKGPQTRVVVSAALAALWLTACGGGGGGGETAAVPAPPAAGGPPSAPAPAPAPSAVAVSTNTQMQVNTAYSVNATGPITLTLPATANVGDAVTVTGVSATPWTVAQNAGQAILTSSLAGNAAVGTIWTPHLDPKMWHWVATNTTGDVLVALDIPGEIHVSTDGGTTWADAAVTNAGAPVHGQIWISADMNATGDRIVAVALGGGMYLSTDRGATFTRIDQAINPSLALQYESVTMSQDGQRIAAVTFNGNAYYSANGGSTFAASTEGGAALVDAFRAVDSSANGQIVVAASQANVLHVSSDGGATFTAVPVVVGGAPVTDTWYRVAVSADGNTILLAGNTEFPTPGTNTGLYLGKNVGGTWTWTRASAVTGAYTSVSMSADASVMSATISNPGGASGEVLVSTDGGQTFTQAATPAGVTDWRAMQVSGDGRSWVLAAGMFTARNGQLYTSMGGRTTYGTAGSIVGAQGNTVVLQYQGNGVWNVQSSAGGAFAIH